jgi:Asp-tRNA(Asn)/Glu-tRNA(Gln) amidotransferase A subunit family amidase
MTPEDLGFTSATDLAALIRRKAVSPVEVIEAFLARIDTVNPQLNAYVTVLSELARRTAHSAEAAVMSGATLGPLHGVPFSVKDLLFTAGVRTTAGSRVFRDFIWIALTSNGGASQMVMAPSIQGPTPLSLLPKR